MAIVWGAYSGRYRLGIDLSRTSSTSSSETWTVVVYLGSGYGVSDSSNKFTVSGAWSHSGSVSAHLPTNGGTQKLWSSSRTFSKAYGKSQSFSVSSSLSGLYAGGSPSVTASLTVAARTPNAPAAPTGVNAKRTADSTISVSWSASSSSENPVSSFTIERSDNGGAWKKTATVGASTRSWSNTSLPLGSYYQYRVVAVGGGGSTVSGVSGYVWTKPTPPINVSAIVSGNDIVVSWTATTPGGSMRTRVLENGAIIATVAGSSYTVKSPDTSVPHQYSVEAIEPAGATSIAAYSNTVALTAAPAPPSELQPSAQKASSAEPLTVSWRHNTRDGSDQTKFEIETSTSPYGPWAQSATGVSAESTALLRNKTGRVFWWRVRTWGRNLALASPWSAPASVEIVDPPTVYFTTSGSIESNETSIGFSSATAKYWQVKLLEGHDTVAEGSGQFSLGKATWQVSGLKNRGAYTVQVRAGSDVWSAWKTLNLNVRYQAPSVPLLTVAVNEDQAICEITNPSQGARVVSNKIERETHSGQWVTVADSIEPNTAWTDTCVPFKQVRYRVVAVSDIGTTSVSVPQTVDLSDTGFAVLTWGDNDSQRIVFEHNITIDESSEPVYDVELMLAGRHRPVRVIGREVRHEITLNALLGYGDKHVLTVVESIVGLRTLTVPVVLRLPDRDTLTGYVSSASAPRDTSNWYRMQVTFVESEEL